MGAYPLLAKIASQIDLFRQTGHWSRAKELQDEIELFIAQPKENWLDDEERIKACLELMKDFETKSFQGKSLGVFISEQAFMSGLNIDDGKADIGLKGLACQLLAASFAGQFLGNGAVNYLEVQMNHDEIGPFTVTIQRRLVETPAQLRRKAEDEVVRLKAEVKSLRAQLNGATDVLTENC